jgi:hypothetical protein
MTLAKAVAASVQLALAVMARASAVVLSDGGLNDDLRSALGLSTSLRVWSIFAVVA